MGQEIKAKFKKLEKEKQQLLLQEQMKNSFLTANKMKQQLMQEKVNPSTLMRNNKHSHSISYNSNSTPVSKEQKMIFKERKDSLPEQKKIIAVKNRETNTQKDIKPYTTIQTEVSRPNLERHTRDAITSYRK